MRLILIALVLGACAPRAPLTPEQSTTQLDVVTAWHSHALPWPSECPAEMQRLRIEAVDDDGMRAAVGYCASGGPTCVATMGDGEARARAGCLLGICAAGSVLRYRTTPVQHWTPTVYVSKYVPERPALAHELVHALALCSTGQADDSHSRAELWGPDGVLYDALLRETSAGDAGR